MAKLSRRKRKDLNLQSSNPETKVSSMSVKMVNKKSGKKHTCIFHKYQTLSDGTVTCSVCNHHFKMEMDEAKMSQYLKNKRTLSLKEIKDLNFHLLEVTYQRTTRGALIELDNKELMGKSAMHVLDKVWDLFWFLSEDMTFDHAAAKELYEQLAQNCDETATPLPGSTGTGQGKEPLPSNIEWLKTARYHTGKKEYFYKNSDGKLFYYQAASNVIDNLPIMSETQIIDTAILSVPDNFIDIPVMRYNEDSVLSRRLIFDTEGNLEEQSICLNRGGLYRVTN